MPNRRAGHSLTCVDQALSTPRAPTSLDTWAADALDELGGLPHVHRAALAVSEGGGRQLLFVSSDQLGGGQLSDGPLAWCHIDAFDDVPLTHVVRHGAVLAAGLDDLDPRYAAFARAKKRSGSVAIAAAPLTADGAVLGGFILYADHEQAFGADDERRLRELGATLGQRLAPVLRPARTEHRPGPHSLPEHFRYAVHEVPADLAALPGARHFLQRTLEYWRLPAVLIDDAAVCFSEVVTNALIHTGGGCRVELQLDGDVLAARVHDDGPTDARQHPPGPDPLEIRGRGLQIVQALASRSGRDRENAVSWFEFDL